MTEATTATPSKPTLQGVIDSLGARARRRGEPRSTISVAGAGCAVAVLGVLLISGDAGAGDGGGFNRWPGAVLSALIVLGGVLAMRTVPRGPVPTAGAVAVLLGIPALIGFTTFEAKLPPFSPEAFLVLSTGGWLAAYLLGPGRGRPVFLGAALVGAWLSVVQLIEKPFDLFGMGFLVMGFADAEGFEDEAFGFGGFHVPDLFVIGVLCLGIAVAYAAATRWCDSRGYRGIGTPFAVATIPALHLGLACLGDDLGATLTGLLFVAAGIALAHHGATLGRRATSWIGGLTVVSGVFVVVVDAVDSAATAGLLFMLIGLCTVWASQLVHTHTREPSDTQLTSGVRPFRGPRRPGPRKAVTTDA